MTRPDETLPEDTLPVAPAPGLQRAGARLPVDEYTRRLWHRRWFVAAYSTASNAVGYEGSFLGQAWQLLTPLLNIAVYYLIFGLLLHTNRGVPNYIAFLSVGVFVFSFCTSSLVAGSRAITGNLGLVRALQFPRAVLPVSTTLVALMRLLYSLVVLIPIVLISGEPMTWRWLELVPAIALQALFCLGLAFVVARIGARVPDMTEILPFVSRVWMYTSGVMYSVQVFTQGPPGLGVHRPDAQPRLRVPGAGPARAAGRQPGHAEHLARRRRLGRRDSRR